MSSCPPRGYNQHYSFVIEFRGGKICAVREYLDTPHAHAVWYQGMEHSRGRETVAPHGLVGRDLARQFVFKQLKLFGGLEAEGIATAFVCCALSLHSSDEEES